MKNFEFKDKGQRAALVNSCLECAMNSTLLLPQLCRPWQALNACLPMPWLVEPTRLTTQCLPFKFWPAPLHYTSLTSCMTHENAEKESCTGYEMNLLLNLSHRSPEWKEPRYIPWFSLSVAIEKHQQSNLHGAAGSSAVLCAQAPTHCYNFLIKISSKIT